MLRCEHKYWSRLEQARVIEEHPGFALVDLDRPEGVPPGLRYPLWLKPAKSVASELAYRVADEQQFWQAVASIRAGIDRLAEPFGFVLDQVVLPTEIAGVGARACLAEEEISGRQLTVEGHCRDGQTRVYGIVESVRYPGTSSFWRYQYPARLPSAVVRRLVDLSRRVVGRVGMHLRRSTSSTSGTPTAAPDSGAVRLLKINPRQSQSHALLFDMVDGVSNHHCMVQLALGGDPEFPPGRGPYAVVAKWYLRRFSDGVVTRVPTAAEVAAIEQRMPCVRIQMLVRPAQRLLQMPRQDSYSYALAAMHIGAADEAELAQRYRECAHDLRFGFAEAAETHPEMYPHRGRPGLAAAGGPTQDPARSEGVFASGACRCQQRPTAMRPPSTCRTPACVMRVRRRGVDPLVTASRWPVSLACGRRRGRRTASGD